MDSSTPKTRKLLTLKIKKSTQKQDALLGQNEVYRYRTHLVQKETEIYSITGCNVLVDVVLD